MLVVIVFSASERATGWFVRPFVCSSSSSSSSSDLDLDLNSDSNSNSDALERLLAVRSCAHLRIKSIIKHSLRTLRSFGSCGADPKRQTSMQIFRASLFSRARSNALGALDPVERTCCIRRRCIRPSIRLVRATTNYRTRAHPKSVSINLVVSADLALARHLLKLNGSF